MMKSLSLGYLLIHFCVFLLIIKSCSARVATIDVPPSAIAYPDIIGPPGIDTYWLQQVHIAFQDAITVARLVTAAFDPCDPVFLRYFRQENAMFVKMSFESSPIST